MNNSFKQINPNVLDFIGNELSEIQHLNKINDKLQSLCGIINFFENKNEILNFKEKFLQSEDRKKIANKSEFGDYQTNSELTDNICKLLKSKKNNPNIVFEPTFGKGNFIISVLNNFENIEKLYGVEIYKPYVWKTKLKILDYFLKNPHRNKPEIKLFHANFFDFDIKKNIKFTETDKFLIIGNPPWVTNSELSGIGSKNLPRKVNFKKHKGLDALTGKGNFDIAEYISNSLLTLFSRSSGNFAFLVKNIVIKNILYEQAKVKHKIGEIEKYKINAKKEFKVSVNASLFFCNLNTKPAFTCSEYDFYTKEKLKTFGRTNNKFVSNIETYQKHKNFDGKCQYEWRQGMKHDASKIMELEQKNGYYVNKFNDKIELEPDLVYGILKSSDLKGKTLNKTRKFTIVTQKKIGQPTSYIKDEYPKTYNYLQNNIEHFNKRKSSIYKGKPLFSIFGIGDYSFKPYKIAISGLYKQLNFTLIKPNENKPIMLDDTCYFIGFDDLEEAEIIWSLLQSENTKTFLKSLIFSDAKRSVTKDLLMRIDFVQIMKSFNQAKDNKLNYIQLRQRITPAEQTKLILFG